MDSAELEVQTNRFIQANKEGKMKGTIIGYNAEDNTITVMLRLVPKLLQLGSDIEITIEAPK